jgi:7-cyano-7-deazaguanine synthase
MPEKKEELAIILVSGGLDSCVTTAIADQEHQQAFLHVNYGQRTEARELKAFHEIAGYYGVAKRLVVDIGYLKTIGHTSLIDANLPVPEANVSRTGVPSTYVPFRNAHFLSIATSWAESIGASKIFIGAVEEDGPTYPDCRKAYFGAFGRAIQLGTREETNIQIATPIIGMTKRQIIERGLALNAPLHLTWSCYQSSHFACGRCDSCAQRLGGFREAGVKDPIPYESDGRANQ